VTPLARLFGVQGENSELIWLPGRSMKQIKDAAFRAAWTRHNGHRGAVQAELRIARSTLTVTAIRLGLIRPRPRTPR
jgi:hypothetical protein